MIKFWIYSLAFICLFALNANSQANILISQGGTVSVANNDNFYDAGGPGGNDGNTNYTITLTPATPGDYICVDFTSFVSYYSASSPFKYDGDSLCIFDGATTSASKLATLMGNYGSKWNSSNTPTTVGAGAVTSQGTAATTTPGIFCSTTGSLTFSFYGGKSSQTAGWVAKIVTYKPLGTPGCNITLTADKTAICPGETVNLTVNASKVSSTLNNNFNSGNIGTGWQGTGSVTFQDNSSNSCLKPSLDGSKYIWMANQVCPRTLTSTAMDVTNGGTVSYDFRQADINGNSSPCEAPDIGSTIGPESVFVQYSIDGGATWVTMKVMFPYDMYCSSCDSYPGIGYESINWRKNVIPIPAAAKTASTQFRWIMPVCTSASTDNWGLDNVIIASPKPTTIRLKKNAANGPVIASSTTSPLNFAVNPTSTTTYFATISDGVDSCTQQVIVNVGIPVTTAIPSACNPVNNQYSVSGTHTFTNSPSTGTLTISSSCGGTPFTQNAPFTSPISYSITGIPSNGASCTVTATFSANTNCNSTVTYTAPSNCTSVTCPTASISYNGPFCTSLSSAQNVTLTGTGTNTGGTYSSTSGLSINASTGAITPSTSTAGTYTVTYTIAASGGCAAVTATTTVVIKALPTATIAYSGPYCTSLTTPQGVTLTGTNNSGGTYSSTSGLTINSSTGAITPSTSTAGTYTVTYTIAAGGGCAAVTATTSVVITALPTASISYAGPFCTSLTTSQAVTLTGTNNSGGTYSSTSGLSINSSTGAIIPSTSTAGSYTVTYTIAASGGCAAVTATTTVVIKALPTATIAYSGPYCTSLTTPQTVTLTGTNNSGGTYSSTSGLTINSSTGAITPSTSTAGTYTVTYTIAAGGGCAAVTATTSVVITALPTATIAYSGPYCKSITAPQAVTLTGTNNTGGTYSSTSGLTINSSTGAVTPSSSTPGTYTVTYTIAATGEKKRRCNINTFWFFIILQKLPPHIRQHVFRSIRTGQLQTQRGRTQSNQPRFHLIQRA